MLVAVLPAFPSLARAQPAGLGRLVIITTFAGNGSPVSSGDGGPALAGGLASPRGMAFDAAGNLYVAEEAGHRVRKISPSGTITTVAGTGEAGDLGDGGPAERAQLRNPRDVAVDAAGILYIADAGNGRVRAVSLGGIITTVAGGGSATGDGIPATQASLGEPSGLAAGSANVLYIADSNGHRVRRLNPDGSITTVGGDGTAGDRGDGGPSTAASLRSPTGLRLDLLKRLLVADASAHRVRRIDTNGTIAGVAGTGEFGQAGDNGSALTVQLAEPVAIAVDKENNFFLAEAGSHRIRRVNTDGFITTLAGRGESGFSGDGGAAPSAYLNRPGGLAIDAIGDLYIADTGNHRIRKVWIADNTPSVNKDGVVNAASFQAPISGNAWVSIYGNHLSLETRTWDSDIAKGPALPAVLGGVRVRVNDKDCFIAFVSPTQLNVLTPPDTDTGSVPVTVIAPQAMTTTRVVMDRYSPGLFTHRLNGKLHALAQIANESTIVAPRDALPDTPSRPARAGDYLQLYATGLGATDPPYPVGQTLASAYPVEDLSRVSVTAGVVPAQVLYAGMVMPGLYQVNVRVPVGVAAGEEPVVLRIEGRSSQPGVVLTFEK